MIGKAALVCFFLRLHFISFKDANNLQEVDGVSSVMYSLGLPGTANMSGIVGSLMYMAPEVVKGQNYTEKV